MSREAEESPRPAKAGHGSTLVSEDPATGAASGPLGCYLVRHDVVVRENVSKIVSEQGIEMGRTSFISISVESANDEISAVKIGGQCQFVGEGFIEV